MNDKTRIYIPNLCCKEELGLIEMLLEVKNKL